MEIVLKRIAKKGTYTIGRLYLLTDASVIILTIRKAASLLERTSSRAWWCELPHLAAAAHQRHDSGARPRRKYLDNHPIDKQHPCIKDAANLFLYIF